MNPGQKAPDIPSIAQFNVQIALAEDVGDGDVTAKLIPSGARATAWVTCREPAVICGQPWFDETFRQLDPGISVEWMVKEGDRVEPDTRICKITGPARAVLTGERTALNFLQTLSGTATAAAALAGLVAGTGCSVLDTRKTIPGLRQAQKYAALCGGMRNHRIGLFDGILIKENHIMAAGSITAAVKSARETAHELTVEVEVETLEEAREAITAGADILLLDDFSLEQMSEAVRLNQELAASLPRDRAMLEASGSVTEETLPGIAATGVDYVSVGAVTKHLRAIDFSMRFTLEQA
ncbi:MAG: carboxylating nicotinate-nucleotide diphosphorylase [Chromatiales bacterium]|nr:carboxylating nicotinate-nucleotide diphosphorylase [Chromatiales bacterium]